MSDQPDLLKRSFEATGITLNLDKVSSDRLSAALESCAEKPKLQYGESFDSENFMIGISDDLYEYSPGECPFSDVESDESVEM